MVVNHARRWVLITPPKTGSTSLTYLFSFPPFAGECATMGEPGPNLSDQHETRIPEACAGYLVIASVRNPYARAVSLYHHRRRTMPGAPGTASFAAFAEGLGGYGDPFFDWPLTRWLEGLRVDRLIRQECLEADVRALGLAPEPYDVPRENVAGAGSWQWAYRHAPGALGRVRSWAGDSFTRFGYTP
jgi:hypothetical protein